MVTIIKVGCGQLRLTESHAVRSSVYIWNMYVCTRKPCLFFMFLLWNSHVYVSVCFACLCEAYLPQGSSCICLWQKCTYEHQSSQIRLCVRLVLFCIDLDFRCKYHLEASMQRRIYSVNNVHVKRMELSSLHPCVYASYSLVVFLNDHRLERSQTAEPNFVFKKSSVSSVEPQRGLCLRSDTLFLMNSDVC